MKTQPQQTDINPDTLQRPEGNDLESLYDDEAYPHLYELYVKQGLTQQEVGDELGFSQHHVSVALRRHDISTRDHTDYMENNVNVKTWAKGYERIYNCGDRLYHHRLLAVAKYGFDAVAGKDVHHKNELSWDNREDNIELLDPSEHYSQHRMKDMENGINFEERFDN